MERIRESDNHLNADELAFLQDILDHRNDSVSVRYKRLGFSGERGTRTQQQLSRNGWIVSGIVPQGRTRIVRLKISGAGKDALGLAEGNLWLGGIFLFSAR